MRHRDRGRKLGRNASHRKAMFRNMACSLIRSVRPDEDDPQAPKVPGRIVTTLPKAKELRPFVEKLVTIARKAAPHQQAADALASTAQRNSDEWKTWRNSSQWQEWAQAVAPALALRRRAFSILRDNEAVDVLFTELAEKFADRPGGYTRVVRLAEVRLGDGGRKALIEFVGERDRTKARRESLKVADETADEDTTTATEEEAPESESAEASEAGAAEGEEKAE